MKKLTDNTFLIICFFILIGISIGLTYQRYIVQKNFEVIETEE